VPTIWGLAVCKCGHVISHYVADPSARTEYPNGKPYVGVGYPAEQVPVVKFCPQWGNDVLTACEAWITYTEARLPEGAAHAVVLRWLLRASPVGHQARAGGEALQPDRLRG
jgi:hypothetical protein